MTLPILPTYYYLDHFSEMLEFVETTYGSVLEEAHTSFMAGFRALTKDEQCLFIRMLNRRGRVFDPATLRYAEISDIVAALGTLLQGGLVRRLGADDYAAWLCLLRKDHLVAIARAAGWNDVRSSWAKPKMIDYFTLKIPFDVAAEHAGAEHFVVLSGKGPVEFLLYLYFGKTRDDLKSFALRDLGIVRVNDAASFKSRFSDAAEARACFYYHQLLDRLSLGTPVLFHLAFDAIFNGPRDGGDYPLRLRDRACHEVGLFFERQKDEERAIALYRASTSSECNERLARLLYALDRKDEARLLLERMIDDPGSDEETHLCQRFLRPQIRRQKNKRGNADASRGARSLN
jgi:DNA polymerase III subunit epsilon